MGKKVYDIKKAPSRITINLEDFYRGIYIFQVRDKNGTIIQSGKFNQVMKPTQFLFSIMFQMWGIYFSNHYLLKSIYK